MSGPPPEWYPDPWRVAPWRWWDGVQWTAFLSYGGMPAAPAVSRVDLGRAYAKEQRTWRGARVALAAVLIGVAGQWFGAISMSHIWHHVWNVTQINNGNSQVVQVNGVSATTALYADLFFLAAAGVSIVFFIWQHSAATVARGLGYPSRTSPGLGVGSWFIPVINLWFPYWALSDTLPPEHPLRGRCLWAWFAYLGANLAGAAAFFVALVSTAAATVPIVISALLAVTAIVLGAQLIQAVSADHHSRLAPPDSRDSL